MVIHEDELPEDVKAKIGLTKKDGKKPNHSIVAEKVVALGSVLTAVKGLSNHDALWTLRTAIQLVDFGRRSLQYKKRASRGHNAGQKS